jgi:hypothetical protein
VIVATSDLGYVRRRKKEGERRELVSNVLSNLNIFMSVIHASKI